MGILNVTPDSFSDGGVFLARENALRHARQMIAEGADWIDLGGESTRPGASAVSESEELDRVMPVLEALVADSDVAISVDTSKPAVMREAIRAGARMINDVNALRAPGALEMLAASPETKVCLMHMRGEPRTMQHNPTYQDVVGEVMAFLEQRIAACVQAGISQERIWIDPGFGFGKTLAHNLALMKHLDQFHRLGCPILVGVSRKSMIGAVLDKPVDQRLAGGLALAAAAIQRGAHCIRTHDVAATRDCARMLWAVAQAED